MPSWFLPVCSTALASLWLVQTWLLGRKHLAGWIISMSSCCLTIPYDVVTHQFGYCVSAALGAVMSVKAYRAWRRN